MSASIRSICAPSSSPSMTCGIPKEDHFAPFAKMYADAREQAKQFRIPTHREQFLRFLNKSEERVRGAIDLQSDLFDTARRKNIINDILDLARKEIQREHADIMKYETGKLEVERKSQDLEKKLDGAGADLFPELLFHTVIEPNWIPV